MSDSDYNDVERLGTESHLTTLGVHNRADSERGIIGRAKLQAEHTRANRASAIHVREAVHALKSTMALALSNHQSAMHEVADKYSKATKEAAEINSNALDRLAVLVKAASETSTKLQKAIARLTLALVIVAALAFVLEVYKLTRGPGTNSKSDSSGEQVAEPPPETTNAYSGANAHVAKPQPQGTNSYSESDNSGVHVAEPPPAGTEQ